MQADAAGEQRGSGDQLCPRPTGRTVPDPGLDHVGELGLEGDEPSELAREETRSPFVELQQPRQVHDGLLDPLGVRRQHLDEVGPQSFQPATVRQAGQLLLAESRKTEEDGVLLRLEVVAERAG